MTSSYLAPTYLALGRFGLGARRGEPLPDDPKRWLTAQLDRFEPKPPVIAAVPPRAEVAQQLADYLEATRAVPGLRQAAPPKPAAMPAAMAEAPARPDDPVAVAMKDQLAGLPDETRKFIQKSVRDNYVAAVGARANAALVTPAPFVERLVHFWANHFAVSADKLPVIGLSGLLEFEAIRPNVMGRFADMLLAVERHPAMLLYLDQAQSVGPSSRIGRFVALRGRKAGLNENLGREILELHTVGVRSGYTQADVTEFARALTGWTVSGLLRGPSARGIGVAGPPGEFVFADAIHEPGARTILGRRYDQQGEAQARAILLDLASHPATARHIATKLARHFAADDPPPALVARLEAAFLRSGGDLPTLYRVLIDSPETWSQPGAKFRSPWDWTVAALRAVGAKDLKAQQVAGIMNQLGQPVWKPGSPAGYDDIAPTWAGPDALVRRVEAADRIAARAADVTDARALAPQLLGDGLTPATAQALARAESPGQALALLLVSPEMLRR
ncbi:MAG: DUF1800 domain-containing protein [Alphaproteobacteria bacterium]|nr:DUF1800 domain-containing protein [Alphaproteobacteria bacterium]